MKRDPARQKWATPRQFFDALELIFGVFTLDVCAEGWSAKCEKYFTAEDDGLTKDWSGEHWFCNPPFGQAKTWLIKGLDSSKDGLSRGVMILPASTDTHWFHRYALQGAVIFVEGRVHFDAPPGIEDFARNNRGSIVVSIGDHGRELAAACEIGMLCEHSGGLYAMKKAGRR